jgi:hypothetical protein
MSRGKPRRPHEVMVGIVIDALAVKLGYRPKPARRRKKAK